MEPDITADLDAVASIAAVPVILEAVCRITGMGFTAIARVTPERWVCLASRDLIDFGMGRGGELEVQTTICDEVRRARKPIVIDSVARDAHYCDHPTPKQYGFQSYISVPIFMRDGRFFGTLCAIDPKPAELSARGYVDVLRLFAELISLHLETAERARRAEASLLDAQASAELREQFIAVLGHDLRNPLNALAAGTSLLQELGPTDDARSVLARMQRSVARMSSLIADLMDFARGRLGGGIKLERVNAGLEESLRHVVDELYSAYPDRTIDVSFELSRPVSADVRRLGQLLSNLLANALVHGDPNAPVRVEARTRNDQLELAVANEGKAIPPDAVPRLFAPFTRAASQPEQQGLGLGLYIVAEIARAHAGTVEVSSDASCTRFTFRMPL